jgi:hypothetical protein
LLEEKTMETRIPIPFCYKWMASGNKKLFTQYVKGYLKNNFPECRPLRIEGDYAICEYTVKRGEKKNETRKKTKQATSHDHYQGSLGT